MKKIVCLLVTIVMIVTMFTGCGIFDETTTKITTEDDSDVKLSYVASFYDNHGGNWLNAKGKSFNIMPNKVKEYYFDSEGTWTWHYAMSSVMSIIIDDKHIETCGSTVIFADDQLKKYEIEIPEDIGTSADTEVDVTIPGELRPKDWWNLQWWWRTSLQNNENIGSRIVVIQSQLGDPICVYAGNSVSWEVSQNLPKTTEINIDGHMVYVHRANFVIIDTAMLE